MTRKLQTIWHQEHQAAYHIQRTSTLMLDAGEELIMLVHRLAFDTAVLRGRGLSAGATGTFRGREELAASARDLNVFSLYGL